MRYFVLLLFISNLSYSQSNFTLDQIKSYPFPNELTGSSEKSRIAWAFDEEEKEMYMSLKDLPLLPED